ncbi:hypothetical protein SLEP1_g39019 [Rubroshorea leprosula]|uniref:Ribosomal protein L33 n=1 Tax=Rubroshorea leprosula TaxID=152421 RepID=A0AAV5KZK8_9ROSI|nr:hypothetical protein SLEP1_g39019 [Rubroshorea leprosula]
MATSCKSQNTAKEPPLRFKTFKTSRTNGQEKFRRTLKLISCRHPKYKR